MQEDNDDQGGSPGRAKRRRYARVSRACNECRARKVRCSGGMPCEACLEFERRCNFTSTRGQRVVGAPRTKILESRLRQARALLSRLTTQNPDPLLHAEIVSIFESPPGSPSSVSDVTDPSDVNSGEKQEDLSEGTGRLIWNRIPALYYGARSEVAFLQQTQLLLEHECPRRDVGSFTGLADEAMAMLFDSPVPNRRAPAPDAIFSMLPSRSDAVELSAVIFRKTHQLFRFLHEPTFKRQTERIYSLAPTDFETLDHDFLPLFHSVMAMGYLSSRKMHGKYSCDECFARGFQHFNIARHGANFERCHNIITLQALVCSTLFLISTSRVSMAYSLTGLAATAAMRLGLHSRTSCEGLSEFDTEVCRKTFWTIIQLDSYSSTLLGLPPLVSLDDVDQLRPNDPPPPPQKHGQHGGSQGTASQVFTAPAQYLDVLLITKKAAQKLYPNAKLVGPQDGHAGGSDKISVNVEIISEIENEFKAWRDRLSELDGSSERNNVLSSVDDLYMAHNIGRIILYRPFLLYLTRTNSQNPPEAKFLRYAKSCIEVSRSTISHSDKMLQRGLLSPDAFQSVYTIFLAVVILVLALVTPRGRDEQNGIRRDANTGIRALASLSCHDMGPRRCLDVLRVLTRRLSPAMDLDVEKISAGVPSLCNCSVQSKGPGTSSSARRRVGDASRTSSSQTRISEEAPQLPQQQFAYRPRTGSATPAHPNFYPSTIPMQSVSQGPDHLRSSWQQSMGVPPVAQSSHPLQQQFHSPPPPAPGWLGFHQSQNVEGADIGDPAWPTYPDNRTGVRRPSQYGTPPFMQLDPGSEPFP